MAGESRLVADYRTYGRQSREEDFQCSLICGVSSFIGAPIVPPITEELIAADVRAAVLGVPWEGGELCRPGTSYGPKHIRLASENYQRGYHSEFQVDLFETLNLVDCGDVAVVPTLATTIKRVERCVAAIYAAGAFPVVFGGDDTISVPVAQAVSELGSGRMGYIHIDSHADTRDGFAGEKLFAGSPVARIAEMPGFEASKIAILGLNGPMAAPGDFGHFVERHRIQVFSLWDIDELGVDEVVRRVIDNVWNGTDGVLLHTDLDSIDHPGVSAPESGALTAREVLRMVRAFVREGVEAYVIVECAPAYDHGQTAARVAVRLALDALAIRANPSGTGRAWPLAS